MSNSGKPDAWPSGLVIVDKPGGMTSHDVVARLRRLAHTRRVGHAGTLDPMATGVLVIGIEKATRLLGHLMLTEKTYAATIRLGQSTTTDDAEGEALPARGVIRAADVAPEALRTEIAKLTGDILQVPSSVSAIKVNGQRAYKLTRAGQAPELAARPVTVYEFTVTATRRDGDFLDVDAVVRCSSGTYIRALARDLGAALGTGGHLTALRRTAVGPYTLAQAHTLYQLENQGQEQRQVQSGERAVPSTVPPAEAAPAAEAPAATASPATGTPPVGAASATAATRPPSAVPWVTPLAAAAAAAFPRLDLTAEDALRLAQGARLPLPVGPPTAPPSELPPGAAAGARAGAASAGPSGDGAAWPATGSPVAAFAPDGTLIALVTADVGRLKSLAVFVDGSSR